MKPRLSILMCALESRALRSYPLRQEILRQIEECSGEVEFKSLFDAGTIPSEIGRAHV